jgi:peptide/nickel transport system permease protein
MTADGFETAPAGDPGILTRAPTSPWRRFIGRMRSERASLGAGSILVAVTLVVFLAPVIAPYPPSQTHTTRILEGPSADFLLGTDDLGRDIFSRLLFAGQISLAAALQATAVAFIIGLPIGLVSGYFGGVVDDLLMLLNDSLMSVPALVLAITIVGFLGPNLTNAMLAIGIVYAPLYVRIVRASTLATREEAYVDAARLAGSSSLRTLRVHIVPNIMSPLVVQTTLIFGFAVLAEASLSFLGLGVQLPNASWGLMLSRSFTYLDRIPLGAMAPGIAIMLVVLAINILGDGIRDALGRQERSAGG